MPECKQIVKEFLAIPRQLLASNQSALWVGISVELLQVVQPDPLWQQCVELPEVKVVAFVIQEKLFLPRRREELEIKSLGQLLGKLGFSHCYISIHNHHLQIV